MSHSSLLLLLLSSLLLSKTMHQPKANIPLLGAPEPQPCQNSLLGFGKPVNSFNYAEKYIKGLFNENAKDLTLIHFSTQIVAGTMIKTLFKKQVKNEFSFVGFKIFVPLPVHNEESSIEKMIVTSSLEEATQSLGLKQEDLIDKPECNADFLKDYSAFSVSKEAENVQTVFQNMNPQANLTKPIESGNIRIEPESFKKPIEVPIEGPSTTRGAGEKIKSVLDKIQSLIDEKIGNKNQNAFKNISIDSVVPDQKPIDQQVITPPKVEIPLLSQPIEQPPIINNVPSQELRVIALPTPINPITPQQQPTNQPVIPQQIDLNSLPQNNLLGKLNQNADEIPKEIVVTNENSNDEKATGMLVNPNLGENNEGISEFVLNSNENSAHKKRRANRVKNLDDENPTS